MYRQLTVSELKEQLQNLENRGMGNCKVVLGDEMITPDSSRLWSLDTYVPGGPEFSFDKQYVRDWLKANPDSGYVLPEEVIEKTSEKYREAYKLLTGKDFDTAEVWHG